MGLSNNTVSLYDTLVKPYLEEVTAYREQNFSVAKVAKQLNVPLKLFLKFMQQKEELRTAWADGEILLTEKLENAAYSEALGYEYVEKIEEDVLDAKGKRIGTKIKKTTKWARPNATILSAALKASKAEKWRAREVEVKELEIIMPDELKELAE